jgi:hypothetical protein
MLKVINAIVATLVLCSLCIGQEVECQNGRCDVIRKAAAVVATPVVVASQVVESTREAYQTAVANRVEARSVVAARESMPSVCKSSYSVRPIQRLRFRRGR